VEGEVMTANSPVRAQPKLSDRTDRRGRNNPPKARPLGRFGGFGGRPSTAFGISARSDSHDGSVNATESFTIVIASPYGPIAMTIEQLHEARSFADHLAIASPICDDEPLVAGVAHLVNAAEAGRQLGVKASWLLARARERRIPHTRIGKYIRFDIFEIRNALVSDECDALIGRQQSRTNKQFNEEHQREKTK
jgi:hypothetical protein